MSNKDRKRELKASFKAKELETLEASMPLSKEDLRGLFEYLGSEVASGCDHTAKKTLSYLRSRSLDSDRIVPWLQELGGYCDCEVLANVEQQFEKILGK
jgi:hypothetical protein